jgi:hypothetical protein
MALRVLCLACEVHEFDRLAIGEVAGEEFIAIASGSDQLLIVKISLQ